MDFKVAMELILKGVGDEHVYTGVVKRIRKWMQEEW